MRFRGILPSITFTILSSVLLLLTFLVDGFCGYLLEGYLPHRVTTLVTLKVILSVWLVLGYLVLVMGCDTPKIAQSGLNFDIKWS